MIAMTIEKWAETEELVLNFEGDQILQIVEKTKTREMKRFYPLLRSLKRNKLSAII